MVKKVIIALFLFLLLTTSYELRASSAQSISSSDLINNAKQYDGKVVIYEGEVIGDVMARKDNAWVNINDGKNAIGVWMTAALAKNISFSGSYKSIGDGIEVTGIFNRACPEHGGDLDIHALSLRKTGQGRPVQEKLNLQKRNAVVILLGVMVSIWILSLLARR